MLARILGVVGRTLVSAGVIILLFVAYEVWGTNLQEAKSQHSLKKQFQQELQAVPKLTTTTSSTPTSTTAPTTTPGSGPGISVTPATTPPQVDPIPIAIPTEGQPLAEIIIPKIDVDKTVVQGVTVPQLKRGPGHYPETPLPGQAGNAAIAGHRTTYGAPFHNVDKLVVGDEIVIKTLYWPKPFRYKIDNISIVSPNDTSVLQYKGDNRITLTACHPKYSATKRIVISGVLVGNPVGKLKGQDAFVKKQHHNGAKGTDTIDGGLSGQKSSKTPAFLFAGLAALVWLLSWGASKLIRRRDLHGLVAWTPYVVGLPIFLLVLYFFFENFSLLLPGNF
ncbi:MAG TPA: sortase [Acidimicrobiales bacterium]